jgi:hypothetical protein
MDPGLRGSGTLESGISNPGFRFPRRRGTTPGEILVVLAIIVIVGLMLMTTLPRQREVARGAACRRNLGQIGAALVLYGQTRGHLPIVRDSGPLEALRRGLGIDDFEGLSRTKPKVPRPVGPPIAPHRVAGFLCPSDRVAMNARGVAPTSYRATAGDDREGSNGPFAFGTARSLDQIEQGEGLGYTSAFCERLVGDGKHGVESLSGYRMVPGPVAVDGCPPGASANWRGDAGHDWGRAGWVDSLYNHAMPPGAATSCVAADGRTAHMVASSGHAEGVHLLRFDTTVGVITPRVDPGVWKRLGRLGDLNAQPSAEPASGAAPDRSR